MTVLHLDNSAGYMHNSSNHKQVGRTGHWLQDQIMSIGENTIAETSRPAGKRPGRRPGRKPSKIDEHAKLERSRQSARECRARKKLRYQYLEELVLNREKAVFALRNELETYKRWCAEMDKGELSKDLVEKISPTFSVLALSGGSNQEVDHGMTLLVAATGEPTLVEPPLILRSFLFITVKPKV